MITKDEKKLLTILKRQEKEKTVIKELKKKIKIQKEHADLKRWQKIGKMIEQETKQKYDNEILIKELIVKIKGKKES